MRRLHQAADSRGNKLIDYALRSVREVSKLRFPDDERVRVDLRVAELKAEHRIFAQRRVAAEKLDRRLQAATRLNAHRIFGLRVGEIVERIVSLLVDFLIVKNMMTMRECAALHVLATDAHVDACNERDTEQQKGTFIWAISHPLLAESHKQELPRSTNRGCCPRASVDDLKTKTALIEDRRRRRPRHL